MKTIVITIILALSASSFASEIRDLSFAAERLANRQAATMDFTDVDTSKADLQKQVLAKPHCEISEENKKCC